MVKAVNRERLGKENLLVAQAVGATGGIDLLQMPQLAKDKQILTPFRTRSFGSPYHDHIYNYDLADQHPLQAVHFWTNELTTGTVETSRQANKLSLAASEIDEERFKDKDFAERVKKVRSDYIDADELDRQKSAGKMCRIVSTYDAFVCARDMQDDYEDPNLLFYGGKITGIVNLRDGDAMRFEPVVSTPSGEGLLPENMYIFQGIYVPTSIQDIKVLHQAADCANV